MMKKGFTLIELLVVIVIIGALAVLVIPGLVKNYEKSLVKAMQIQENNIKDAAKLMATDYCNQPSKQRIKTNNNPAPNDLTCRNENAKMVMQRRKDNTTGKEVEENKYVVCLDTLKAERYYDNELEYEKQACYAFTMFHKDEKNKFEADKAYILCGDENDADYITDNAYEMLDYFEVCGSGFGSNNGEN